jgi:hypothetical protein
MADQQTQAQQMLDTLKLTPGFDPTNTLPADPTASPLTTAPAAPTQPPSDPPANTSTSSAPLNVDPSVTPNSTGVDGNLGRVTTPTLDLSQPPDTTSPPLSLNSNLNSSVGSISSPDTAVTPDVSSAATIGLNSGLDTSFNSGLNTSFNSGLNTGFNSGLNTGFNSGLNTGFNSGLNTGFKSGLDSGLNSGLNSGINSGLNSSLNSGLDSSFNSGLNSSFNSGLGSSFSLGLGSSSSGGLDTGLGSSSSISDFGDSSVGGDSFGGDAGGGDIGPVVLDLSGQGIRINGLGASHATFDANGDGVPNRIAWTTPDEGLLVYDANGSGTVDQTSELALRQWTPGAQTDLQGLRSFDTNHDGKLDAGDKDFGSFDVWQDTNGNGISDPGELHSLVDAGVSSISLASDGVQSHLPDGSTIYGQGSFTRTNGTSGRLADVSLAYGPDINTARDQLVGAMAVGPSRSAPGTTAPMSSPVAAVAPMLGADIVSPLHVRT